LQRILSREEKCIEEPRMQARRVIMIEVFIRNDDVESESDNLTRLIDRGLQLRVPISFGIIPATLTRDAGKLVNSVKRSHPELIEIHQHGWAHINHEGKTGRGEFGAARSYDQQRDDLRKGRNTLEEIFGDGFFPAFSPPWNVYTADTVRAMKELGFLALSAGPVRLHGSGQGIQHYPIALDLLWGGQLGLQSPRALFLSVYAILRCFQGPVGLLLHHRGMDSEAFKFLDSLLHRLLETGQVVFHSFEALERVSKRLEETTKSVVNELEKYTTQS
jgi:peptidoglycan/xylan/chitin deacetylase (PgdA/CDA1 family)